MVTEAVVIQVVVMVDPVAVPAVTAAVDPEAWEILAAVAEAAKEAPVGLFG